MNSLDAQYEEIAKEQGIPLSELLALVAGRKCEKYPGEALFVLRGRGGKLQVRNVSKRAHVENMQSARKKKD